MDSTPLSLLEQVRRPDDQRAWGRFVFLYTPLLYRWARHFGLQDTDAADLLQDVFAILVRKLPEFEYDGNRSFRKWLYTVTLNRWRDNCKLRGRQPLGGAGADLLAIPAPDGNGGDDDDRGCLVMRALELVRGEFQPTTWQACWQVVVEGRPVAEVARQLRISENAVYIAKYRILNRLRQELDGLID